MDLIVIREKLKNLSILKQYNFDNRYVCNKKGEVFLIVGNKYKRMSPFITRDDYVEYVLTERDGYKRHIQAHRLVALLYIPNPKQLGYVNHINHNRSDNRVENLEWVTQSDNLFKRYEHARNNNIK